MDIVFDQAISYDGLMQFLKEQLPDTRFFLVYDGVSDVQDLADEKLIFQYVEDNKLTGGFKYGLYVYVARRDDLPLFEQLSWQLSNRFLCRVFCDASRIILTSMNLCYVLLFEQGNVYLANDEHYDVTGQITKICELSYTYPIQPSMEY